MILTTHPDGTCVITDAGLEVTLAPDGTLARAQLRYPHDAIVPIVVTPPPDDAPARERQTYAETVAAWQAVARQAVPCPSTPVLRRTA